MCCGELPVTDPFSTIGRLHPRSRLRISSALFHPVLKRIDRWSSGLGAFGGDRLDLVFALFRVLHLGCLEIALLDVVGENKLACVVEVRLRLHSATHVGDGALGNRLLLQLFQRDVDLAWLEVVLGVRGF